MQLTAYSFCGDSRHMTFPLAATLADLAGQLVEWHGRCRYVAMCLKGRVPNPFDWNKTIVDFVAEIPEIQP